MNNVSVYTIIDNTIIINERIDHDIFGYISKIINKYDPIMILLNIIYNDILISIKIYESCKN